MRKLGVVISITSMALFLTACAVSGFDKDTKSESLEELQILVTSDVHGRYMPYNYEDYKKDTNGSLTQMYTAIQKLRTDRSILVDVGDSIILLENIPAPIRGGIINNNYLEGSAMCLFENAIKTR